MSDQSLLSLRRYVEENATWIGQTAQDFRGFDIDLKDGRTLSGYALEPSPRYELTNGFIDGLPQGWQAVRLTMMEDMFDEQVLTDDERQDGSRIDFLTTMSIGERDLEWVEPYDWGYTDTDLAQDTSDYMPPVVLPDVMQLDTEHGVVK